MRWIARTFTVTTAAVLALALALAPGVEANHPVLVEGNSDSPVPGTTLVSPGTSGDFDGDGRIGTAEDTDGADRIFGTISAALGPGTGAAAGTGANANGKVVIVTSGRFAEQIRIPNVAGGQPLNGVTVLEAAPGVEANIDAVLQGDPAGGNAVRQAAPGIIVDTAFTDRIVILRNLQIRNFTVGIQIQGNARVTVEKCRFDSNVNGGVLVQGRGRLTMSHSSVQAGGMRFTATKATPNPGFGILFADSAGGCVAHSNVSNNTAGGIVNAGNGVVRLHENVVCDNAPNFLGLLRDIEGRLKVFN